MHGTNLGACLTEFHGWGYTSTFTTLLRPRLKPAATVIPYNGISIVAFIIIIIQWCSLSFPLLEGVLTSCHHGDCSGGRKRQNGFKKCVIMVAWKVSYKSHGIKCHSMLEKKQSCFFI